MNKIYFWRHGESDYNLGITKYFDSSLTSKGRSSCDIVAEHLQHLLDKDFTVFVSPYHRTLQTAFFLYSRYPKCRYVVDKRICENVRELQNQDRIITARKEEFNFIWNDEEFNFNNITQEQYRDDIKNFVRELPQKAVIVSHMTTIGYLLQEMTGLSEITEHIKNASMSLVENNKAIYIARSF